MNHSEVVEEDKRNKEPANIEAKRKRLEWEELEAKRKKECKEQGTVIISLTDMVVKNISNQWLPRVEATALTTV